MSLDGFGNEINKCVSFEIAKKLITIIHPIDTLP